MQTLLPVIDYAQAFPLGQLSSRALLALHETHPQIYPFLLQSTAVTQGSYDLLLAFPSGSLTLTGNGQLSHSDYPVGDHSFLEALDTWWQQSVVPQQVVTFPFSGGWFVFLGYELAAQIEKSLHPLPGGPEEIVAQATRIPVAIVRDAVSHEAWLIAEINHAHRRTEVLQHIGQLPPAELQHSVDAGTLRPEEEPADLFVESVQCAKEHIAAGDVYQVNLSRGWRTPFPQSVHATTVYRQLCAANPAPFAGLAMLRNGEYIISSSPERLIRTVCGEVSTRPIAGTRPRSQDQQRDAQLIEELRNHPKEQAEHIMLLDLERNDLGRLCEPGSVQVDEYMTVESYAHVHHIVSGVSGKLRRDVTPGQAIAAVFPGGTITGCPKVRCMQIIAELERVRRGAYTGSMGYLNRDGSMDLNILIRTLQVRGQQLLFRAGAGIVADSIADKELEETRAKALGMIRALGAPC